MADKAPGKGSAKKPAAKNLKEKRAAKKEKRKGQPPGLMR
jgi:hypothetical protein